MTDITWTTEQRKLSDLAEWEHNPAEITDHDAQQLKRSIDKFGLALPLIANVNGGLIDGHQRKMVMLMLDGHLPSELVDVRIPSRELSEDERTELAVRLRRNVGQWNWDMLANEFEIDDLKDWGFTDVDFELAGWDTEEEPLPDPGPQIDKAAELQEKWGTALDQVWELGEHRLVCGDCTDAAVVEAVMEGKRAEMLFTDPPYGVDYTGGHFHSGNVNIKRERERLAGDKEELYSRFIPAVLPFVDGPCYVWFASSVGKPVYDAVLGYGCEIHAMLVWHKINATYAAMNAQYKQRHEPCLYFKPKGSTLRWCGPTDECTLWEIKRDAVNEFHPTQKPIELAERAMGNHEVAMVLDCFLGSGTTLIACERLNRRCRAIEIEPKYVAVTLQRWHDMTNREPKLVAE